MPDLKLTSHKEEGIKDDGDREDATILFFCPNEGCVKIYERQSSFEKHLFFGKCRIKAEKENLLEKAKRTYHTLLKEGTNTAKALRARTVEMTDGVSLSEGWALKSPHDSMML